MFKFLRCYPFDEQKVFNDQVVQKWRTRADPESVAKLKTLITCLALRRPKTTIELLPRKDEVIHLRFNREECEDYQKVKSQTIYKIGNVNGEGGGTSFLNALKWVNELRLMCIHGTRNAKEMQQIEGSQPAWSMQQAQTGFDELEKAGLAKCLNTLCSQDLSSTLSSETGAEHEDEPWISESLELWCSSCFNSRNTISPKAFKVCNHLPRRLQKKNIMDEKGINVFGDDSSIRSSLDTADKNGRLPTKVKALLQHLLEAPEDTKRFIPSIVSSLNFAESPNQRNFLLLDQDIRHHSAPALEAFHPLRPPRRHPFRQRPLQRPPRLPHQPWNSCPPCYDILRRYRA